MYRSGKLYKGRLWVCDHKGKWIELIQAAEYYESEIFSRKVI